MPDLQSGVYPIGAESLQDESESIFENKTGLAEDLKFLASMPELCDITFLVGETREPVCAVKVRTLTQFLLFILLSFDGKKHSTDLIHLCLFYSLVLFDC